MVSAQSIRNLEKTIGLGLLLTTISTTPMLSMDPINPPKMLSLVIFAVLIGGQLTIYRKKIEGDLFKNLFRFTLILELIILANLFITKGDFWTKFFGVSGRNTGALTYICLTALLFISAVVMKDSNLSKIYFYINLTGTICLIYGLVQALNFDPFSWSNPYSPVFGFLGNPNFHSSFIAMFAVGTFSFGLNTNLPSRIRVTNFFITVLCLVSVFTTKSQQGFLVFAAGILLPLYLALRERLSKIQMFIGICAAGAISVLSVLGMLQIGPLKSLLYKDSVTYRGDYWRAGWKMALENPLFGVGFDQYGNWYRRTRSVEATIRRGPEFTSNAAHNVFIDFAASGGFLLLAIYLLLIGLTIKAIRDICRVPKIGNPIILGLIGMWIAYQAQSIISINQIGLAIWGWVLSGTIIGYSYNLANTKPEQTKDFSSRGPKIVKNSNQQLSAGVLLYSILFVCFGAIIAGPVMINSMKFKSALESASQPRIISAAHFFPYDETRMGEIALLLTQNKLDAEALTMSKEIISRYPDSFQAWRLISQLSTSTPREKEEAFEEMKRLDPNNPDLKK